MIIQRLFSEKKRDEKKAKIAAGVAIGSGLAGAGLDEAAVKQLEKADDIRLKHNRNLDERAQRIAKKTGTKSSLLGNFIIGDPEKVKKAEEMGKRHSRVIQRAIDKRVGAANKMGKGSLGLAAVSLGSGAYGLKKMRDAKKKDE